MKETVEIHRTDRGGIPRFEVVGAVDIYSCGALRDQLKAMIESDYARIDVDLKGVRYLDSSGISVLVSAFVKLRNLSRRLVIIGVSEQVLRVFKILKLDSLLEIGTPASDPAVKQEPRINPGASRARRSAVGII